MSSLKMTFSLTSLILIIALGLVFVPTSVMAHDAEQSKAGTDDVTTDDIPTHETHPVKVEVPAVTSGENQAGMLPKHGKHPTVTITLEGGGTEAVVAPDDATTTDVSENVVNLVVQFNMPTAIGTSATETEVVEDLTTSASLLGVDNFTVVIRDNSGTTPALGAIVTDTTGTTALVTSNPGDDQILLGTVVRTEPDAGTKFVVPLTIPADAMPTGTADEDDEKFHLIIKVNGNIGYGLRESLRPDNDPLGADIVVDGGASQASMIETFTLVKDSSPVAVTPSAPTKVGAGTDIEVSLAAAMTADTVPTGLMASHFTVMEGDTTLTPMVDEDTGALTITPEDLDVDSTVTIAPSTAGMAKITFTQVSVAVDRSGPMVEITPPTDAVVAGQPTTAMIGVTGADTGEAVEVGDITVTQDVGGALSVLLPSYNPTTGTVTFTPTAASTVTVSVDANAVMDDVMNGNAAASIDIDVVSPTAVSAVASPTKVNGSTNVVVTISATAPATVPTLMASDFSVMEATAAGVVQSPTVVGYANNMLTITPDADATADTTITVSTSTSGAVKIELADVMVSVDRAAPVVMIAPPTGTVKAGQAAMATVTISGGDTGEAVAAGEITVAQTVTGSDPSVLGHTYDAATGVVTFTPTAESTVTVSVDAGAVMDDVMNGSAAQSIDITVAAADTVDTTPPTVTITAGTQSGRTLPVSFDFADDSGSVSYDALEDDDVEVVGGTISVSVSDDGDVTGTITINYDVTEVTVTVAAGVVSDSAATPNVNVETSATFTVRATSAPVGGSPTDADNILSGLSIPAETYLVIARSDVMGLPSGVTSVTWNGMPDLEALLFSGGTINVTRAKTPQVDHDNDDPDGNGKKADGTTDASAKRDIGARDVVITEVMAALNTATPGDPAAKIAHQWIEVHNKLKVPVSGITISTKAGHPAGFPTGAPTDEVLLDRLSNVVGVGWAFTGLGKNGSNDGNPETADVPFVSFYRNNTGEPGWQNNRWSTSSETYLTNHQGTPGAKERAGVKVLDTDTLDLKTAIINEVGNFPTAKKDYEWIEIRVTSDTVQNFKDWELEIITAAKTSKSVVVLPQIPDPQRIGKDGILLVTSTDPADDPNHPLAPGYNVMKNDANQARGVPADHPVRYLVKSFANELPADEFVLLLRTDQSKGDHETVKDVAGYHSNLKVDEAAFFSNLWPLRNFGGPVSDKNRLSEGEVHYRQHTGVVGTGTTHGDKKDDQVAMRAAPWTGIGYKRNAADTAQNGGTPGYPNMGTDLSQGGALVRTGDTAKQSVIISEVMYSADRNLPQWIELQNMSNTVGINLDNWSLFVVNHNLDADGEEYDGNKLSERIDLDGKIPPGQTFLIASTSNRHTTNLPNARVWDLRRGVGEKLLNSNGFYLTLKAETHEGDAAKHVTIDVAGNLADPATLKSRRADAQSFEDLAWELPNGVTEDRVRVSISRKTGIVDKDGTKAWSWISSDMDPRLNRIKDRTHYGHSTDISSPGMTVGSALPVSLSKFRPERMKDTGEIVIRWITESELNNAGFNILRSETRNGEFTKVHFEAGKGTTSERTAYEWSDKSAKPNVVYYYQIQDVSLDGDVTTLRITHLRGNVTATGKLTTTWGEIKALQ
ncbi:lamin tail domain-containing protein [Candidatus Poribacteria bacterium]|nr:lamin tail domain-containing protein [Candidatus Poribacteria bacterium]